MSSIYVIASAVGAVAALQKECPKCHSKQLTAPIAAGVPDVCKECGALIPSARPIHGPSKVHRHF